MPGHLQKKGGRYYAVIEEPKDPLTGRRRTKWISTGCKTEKEALPVYNRIMHEYDTGQYIEPSKLTVAAYLLQWLEIKKPKSTVYKRNIEKHIVPSALGAIPLAKLKPMQVQKYYASKEIELSPATIALHHNILNAAFRQAVRWEMLGKNPLDAVIAPKVEKKHETTWSEDEQIRFLDAAKEAGDPFYVAYCVALITGLRRGEVVGLQWSDIDIDARTLTVNRIVTKDGSEYVTRPHKSKAGHRTLKIPAELVSALKVHRAQCRLSMHGYDETGLVFTDKNASPLNPDKLARQFEKAVERAGVPRIRFHGTRHTYATSMLQDRIPLKTVSEMLGHTSIRITADIYSHVTSEMQEEAAEAAGAILRRKKA